MCHHHHDQLREVEFELVEDDQEAIEDAEPEHPPAVADGGEPAYRCR